MKKNTLLTTLLLTISLLTACNSGQQTKVEPQFLPQNSMLAKALYQNEFKYINLSGSALMQYETSTKYHFSIQNHLNFANLEEGNFSCANINDCLIKLPDSIKNQSYINLVVHDANNNFIGATAMDISNLNTGGTIAIANISPDSSGSYLSSYMQHLSTSLTEIEFLRKFQEAFTPTYNKLVAKDPKLANFNSAVYFYFKYKLTKADNSSSFNDIMQKINSEILNNTIQFPNPELELTKYHDYINKRAELEQNAALQISINNFKEKFGNIVNVISEHGSKAIGVAEKVFPAIASAKVITEGIKPAFDITFQALDFVSNMTGSKSSLSELEKLKTELNQFSIPAPSTENIIAQILQELQKNAIYSRYKDLKGHLTEVDTTGKLIAFNLQAIGVEQYLDLQMGQRGYKVGDPQLSWIVKNGQTAEGVFNMNSLKKIEEAAQFISDSTYLSAYIDALKTNLVVPNDKSHNINTIENRRAYNHLITKMLFDITTQLSTAQSIDKIAFFMVKESKYKESFSGLISLPISVKAEKDIDALFKKRLEQVRSIFYAALVPEYELVPNYDELSKTCVITQANGYDNVEGECKYSINGKIEYNVSTLNYNPSSTSCLPIANDQGGGLANVGGELSCRIKEAIKIKTTEGDLIKLPSTNDKATKLTIIHYLAKNEINPFPEELNLENSDGMISNHEDKNGFNYSYLLAAGQAYNSSTRTLSHIFGCIYDKCRISDDGVSLKFGKSDLKLGARWSLDMGPRNIFDPETSLELRVGNLSQLAASPQEHKHTAANGNTNTQLTKFEIQSQDGVEFTEEDFAKIKDSMSSYFNNLKNGIVASPTMDSSSKLSFKLNKGTVQGVVFNLFFHQKGKEQTCQVTIFNTKGSAISDVTATKYSFEPTKCGNHKLYPGTSYFSSDTTIRLGN